MSTQCCSSSRTKFHLVNISLLVIIISLTATPILVGVSNINETLSLISAIFATVTIFVPFLSAYCSWEMEDTGGCLYIPFIGMASTIRCAIIFILHCALIGITWFYYVNGDIGYYYSSIVIACCVSGINFVGTCVSFSYLYPEFAKRTVKNYKYDSI